MRPDEKRICLDFHAQYVPMDADFVSRDGEPEVREGEFVGMDASVQLALDPLEILSEREERWWQFIVDDLKLQQLRRRLRAERAAKYQKDYLASLELPGDFQPRFSGRSIAIKDRRRPENRNRRAKYPQFFYEIRIRI